MPSLTKKPAVYYNQDDLTDFANIGGSIIDEFNAEIESGNIIVIEQKPYNAPAITLAVLKSKADVEHRKNHRQSVEDCLFKILNPAPPS
jgi:hypothetical protein